MIVVYKTGDGDVVGVSRPLTFFRDSELRFHV